MCVCKCKCVCVCVCVCVCEIIPTNARFCWFGCSCCGVDLIDKISHLAVWAFHRLYKESLKNNKPTTTKGGKKKQKNTDLVLQNSGR